MKLICFYFTEYLQSWKLECFVASLLPCFAESATPKQQHNSNPLLESFIEEKQSCTRFTEEITSSSATPLPVSPSEKNTQKQIVEYLEDKHRFTAYPDHFLSLITTIRQKKTKLGILTFVSPRMLRIGGKVIS